MSDPILGGCCGPCVGAVGFLARQIVVTVYYGVSGPYATIADANAYALSVINSYIAHGPGVFASNGLLFSNGTAPIDGGDGNINTLYFNVDQFGTQTITKQWNGFINPPVDPVSAFPVTQNAPLTVFATPGIDAAQYVISQVMTNWNTWFLCFLSSSGGNFGCCYNWLSNYNPPPNPPVASSIYTFLTLPTIQSGQYSANCSLSADIFNNETNPCNGSSNPGHQTC